MLFGVLRQLSVYMCHHQVNLTSELSSHMAHLSSMQMELTGCRQREAELKTQLATAVAESQKTAENWISLRQNHDGTDH